MEAQSSVQLVLRYFPKLSEVQVDQLTRLGPLYEEWNAQINVISRKDIGNLYERHVLHSLAIARVISFAKGTNVLDLGTGGGFPGVPLAILFPETSFTLVDGTGKKIQVVQAVSEALGLKNIQAFHKRAEELKETFDFVLSRGVAPLDKLMGWCRPLLRQKQVHGLPNGLLALKGGNLKQEVKDLGKKEYVEIFPIQDFFQEAYFDEKFVVYVQG
ncbi:MAG: 16S rRNA (guanine(527)-N(7))-methyltransferase RsmG [Saprospirales bacterium]|nr:16S rRNA (guanine(527)-N(7))-methyltransferase RsmG [Saprospirales bacterium]MBK8493023.1 16S rRNA (guanine(527)-N(7))-methyltransferase RsmG [Saprospirales bacterium]